MSILPTPDEAAIVFRNALYTLNMSDEDRVNGVTLTSQVMQSLAKEGAWGRLIYLIDECQDAFNQRAADIPDALLNVVLRHIPLSPIFARTVLPSTESTQRELVKNLFKHSIHELSGMFMARTISMFVENRMEHSCLEFISQVSKSHDQTEKHMESICKIALMSSGTFESKAVELINKIDFNKVSNSLDFQYLLRTATRIFEKGAKQLGTKMIFCSHDFISYSQVKEFTNNGLITDLPAYVEAKKSLIQNMSVIFAMALTGMVKIPNARQIADNVHLLIPSVGAAIIALKDQGDPIDLKKLGKLIDVLANNIRTPADKAALALLVGEMDPHLFQFSSSAKRHQVSSDMGL